MIKAIDCLVLCLLVAIHGSMANLPKERSSTRKPFKVNLLFCSIFYLRQGAFIGWFYSPDCSTEMCQMSISFLFWRGIVVARQSLVTKGQYCKTTSLSLTLSLFHSLVSYVHRDR